MSSALPVRAVGLKVGGNTRAFFEDAVGRFAFPDPPDGKPAPAPPTDVGSFLERTLALRVSDAALEAAAAADQSETALRVS